MSWLLRSVTPWLASWPLALLVVLLASTETGAQPGGEAPETIRVPSVTLDVTPGEGTLDDRYVATVRVAHANDSSLEHYQPPGFDDFEIVDRKSDQTWAQGGSSGTSLPIVFLTYHYVLTPRTAGILRIEPARVRIDGEELRSRARGIRVRDGLDDAPGSPAGTGQDPGHGGKTDRRRPGSSSPAPTIPPLVSEPGESWPEIFVRVHADRTTAFVGQQVTVTWMVYTRHELIEIEPNAPRLDDFWSEILSEPSTFVSQRQEIVGGMRYQVYEVSRRALFPLRAGQLQLAPYSARLATLYTPLGSTTEVRSEPLDIEVRALPAGAPAGFHPSYVGMFRLQASVDRRSIALGESAILTLVVKGHGALRRTLPPKLEFEGFVVEPPRDYQESVQTTGTGLLGQRVYRYWCTPERPGEQTIPAIAIPYFDPRSGSYHMARSQPIAISVVAAEPAHSGPRARTASRPSPARGTRVIPWLAAGIAGLVLLALASWQVRRRRGSATATAGHAVEAGFLAAREHLAGGRTTDFFGALASVLEHTIARYLARSIRSLTREQLLAALAERGLDVSNVECVASELRQCDLARFASSRAPASEMEAALHRVRELVRELERARRHRQEGRASRD